MGPGMCVRACVELLREGLLKDRASELRLEGGVAKKEEDSRGRRREAKDAQGAEDGKNVTHTVGRPAIWWGQSPGEEEHEQKQ